MFISFYLLSEHLLRISLVSPHFEHDYGYIIRGSLKVVKEKWLSETIKSNLLDYVSKFKEKLSDVFKIEQENLKTSQQKMKSKYDVNTKIMYFKPGYSFSIFTNL